MTSIALVHTTADLGAWIAPVSTPSETYDTNGAVWNTYVAECKATA